jgi:carbamoyl-phosphate synthase small subunit
MHRQFPLFSVQYHPEASPGPHDANYLFRRFVEMIEQERRLVDVRMQSLHQATDV